MKPKSCLLPTFHLKQSFTDGSWPPRKRGQPAGRDDPSDGKREPKGKEAETERRRGRGRWFSSLTHKCTTHTLSRAPARTPPSCFTCLGLQLNCWFPASYWSRGKHGVGSAVTRPSTRTHAVDESHLDVSHASKEMLPKQVPTAVHVNVYSIHALTKSVVLSFLFLVILWFLDWQWSKDSHNNGFRFLKHVGSVFMQIRFATQICSVRIFENRTQFKQINRTI